MYPLTYKLLLNNLKLRSSLRENLLGFLEEQWKPSPYYNLRRARKNLFKMSKMKKTFLNWCAMRVKTTILAIISSSQMNATTQRYPHYKKQSQTIIFICINTKSKDIFIIFHLFHFQSIIFVKWNLGQWATPPTTVIFTLKIQSLFLSKESTKINYQQLQCFLLAISKRRSTILW